MNRQPIPTNRLRLPPVFLWSEQWMLLAAGDFGKGRFNAMTVAWGSIGSMWDKPFVQVVVRPSRYTFEFMEAHGSFTLNAFPPKYRPVLSMLGSRSGRDGDKIKASGLTPAASTRVEAPSFAEAELVLECRKMYWSDLDPRHFLDPAIESIYPMKDYHRAYFGEILAVLGTEPYRT